MGFLDFLACLITLYYLIKLILLCNDCDIELLIKSYLGTSISTLNGKVVWITGASSGIGKSLALELAKHGVKLVLSARRNEVLESVKTDCLVNSAGKLTPNDILVLKMDMLNISKHEHCFDKVLRHFNGIDILVNNAGRSQRADWTEISLSVDKEVFDLDVFSVVNLSRIVARHFLSVQKVGHIAVTSSTAGLIGVPSSASYSGAKFAIHGYFEALRVEYLKKIHVTLFCPGPTRTDFLQQCFTARDGETYGQTVQPTDRRMTSERCGYLFAVSLANKIHMAWCGVFPLNFLVYISLYSPNFKRIMMNHINLKKLAELRDSRVNNI